MPGPVLAPSISPILTESIPCERLIELVAQGDTSAFDLLYRSQMPAVTAVATRLLRDNAQGKEVAHEVMLNMWQKAGQFNASLGSGRAWILQLTRSRAIDRIRSCEHSRARDLEYSRGLGRTDSRDTFDLVMARSDASGVQSALLQLTVVQREALVLAYFSQLSYPQIAAQLQVPLPTVKTRIRDGLIRLRKVLSVADQEGPLAA